MFNNRHSRRRFRLGNLARLVHLRQSVSHQPPQPSAPQPPKDLREILLQSPPQSPAFQPQPQSPSLEPPPYQFPPSPSTLPKSFSKAGDENRQSSPRILPEPNSTPRSSSLPPQPQTPSFIQSPNQFSSPMPLPSTRPPSFSETGESRETPPLVPPEPKLSPQLPLSPKSEEEPQSQTVPPPVLKPPPSQHESSQSQAPLLTSVPPTPPLTLEEKKPSSPSSTLNAIEESQSQPSPSLLPSNYINETRFRSPFLSKASPSSLSESCESQPPLQPPEVNTPPPTLKPDEESQSQLSPLLLPSRSFDETRLASPPSLKAPLPASLSESVESPPPLPPPQVKTPPMTLKPYEEFQPKQSPPLPPSPSKASPQPFAESGDFQPSLPQPDAKIPESPPSTLNATKESNPQLPTLSKSIEETRLGSPSPLQTSPPSGESQLPFPPSLPSTLNATKESNQQSPTLSKSIEENRFGSPSLSQTSPPPFSESGESQLPLPPSETKIPSSPPLTLNATEESKSQSPPPLVQYTSIDETRSPSPPPSQASPLSSSESGESKPPLPTEEAKIPSFPPSTLNASEESQSQPLPPLPPSKSVDEPRSQSPPPSTPTPPTPLSNSIEEPNPTPPSPESDQQSRSQIHSSTPPSSFLSPKATAILKSQSPLPLPSVTALMSPSQSPITAPPSSPPISPPSIPSPLKSQIVPSHKPSIPEMKPNPIESHSPKPINTESHTSQDHNKDVNGNQEKQDPELMKIPAEEITRKVIENRERKIWAEKTNSLPMIMFVNSNVQGINSSLSLDSYSIDHEPGVHLTIDYDQSCDFSSTLY